MMFTTNSKSKSLTKDATAKNKALDVSAGDHTMQTSHSSHTTPSIAFNTLSASDGSSRNNMNVSNPGGSSRLGLSSDFSSRGGVRGSLNTVAKTNSMTEFSHRTETIKSEMEVLANSFERRVTDTTGTKNSFTKDLSVNKLRFHQVELVGREHEKNILKERLESLTSNIELRSSSKENAPQSTDTHVGHRELIMISGVSGSGKSALAMTLQEQLKGRGVFVRGKFDIKASDKPYSTIITACHDLGVTIQNLNDGEDADGQSQQAYQDIQGKLCRELVGMELQVLLHTVPALNTILVVPTSTAVTFTNRRASGDNTATTKRPRTRPGCLRASTGQIVADGPISPPNTNLTILTTSNRTASNPKLYQGTTLSGQTKELLESAFKKFFRTVSFYFAPLILTLDDLQWSDIHTLELLKGILSDTTNPHIMIVGCYRSNEVDQTHSLAKLMRDLKQTQDSIGLHMTELHIDNLGPNESHQILMALLNIDDAEKTKPLADLCHQRTLGNPFFFLVYVDMLYRNGMLSFHLGTFDWQWDISQIKAATAATANVVDLMIHKILNCSKELVHLLKLACCLGSEFTGAVLFLVWAMSPEVTSLDEQGSNGDAKDVVFKRLLEECMREKFLEYSDDGLRWSHDKVQEAAMLLEPEETFGPRKYQVGQTLYSCLDGEDLEDALFCVVNLLNSGHNAMSEELSKLNLCAAKKAKVFGAISAQAEYSEMGLDVLPSNCWKRCKELTLELYTIRAESASSMGEFEVMERYCEVVFSQEEYTIVDQIPCYKVWIHNFSRHGKYDEAIKLELEVLGKLGCKLPRGTMTQAAKAVGTLLVFKQRLATATPTTEDLQQIPLMTDPVKKLAMSLLASLILHAYVTKKSMLWLLGTIKMVQLTLRYGVADESQLAFSSAAVMITHALGDWKTGAHYAHLSLEMYDKLPLNERSHRSSTLCVSPGLVLSWIKPLQCQLRFMMEGYRSGMELGDVEWAFSSIAVYVEMSLYAGSHLRGLSEDIRIYLSQFESMCTNGDYAKRTRMVWQVAMNLTGNSENTTVMSGSAVPEEYALESDTSITGLFFRVLKSFLCVHFGNHEQGALLAIERGDSIYDQSPGHPLGMSDPFLRAMSLYAMARKTGKSKYARHAKKARATVKAWVKKGNPNVYHQLELLNAERAVLSKRKDTSDLYYKAARLASRGGWIHDAALASERHAEYLIETGDKGGAIIKLTEAIDRYSGWGAIRKADLLKEMYEDMLL